MTVFSTGATSTNPLAIQFAKMVARLIETNRLGGFGIRRQLFMVSLGGFDTHDNQNQVHGDRLAQLNHAMAYFDMVLGGMPGGDMRSQVTTFTRIRLRPYLHQQWRWHRSRLGLAPFRHGRGRAWHRGMAPSRNTARPMRKAYSGSPDQLQNGVMLPTTSVDQYAYNLGRWMGVSQSDLLTILPNLNQFNSSAYDLGFMS